MAWGEAAQQLGLEGPVGVGDVVDGVQDAAELLDHVLRESWQDQVEAQAAISDGCVLGVRWGPSCWKCQETAACSALATCSRVVIISGWAIFKAMNLTYSRTVVSIILPRIILRLLA